VFERIKAGKISRERVIKMRERAGHTVQYAALTTRQKERLEAELAISKLRWAPSNLLSWRKVPGRAS
jgi:hypothetical protein